MEKTKNRKTILFAKMISQIIIEKRKKNKIDRKTTDIFLAD